MATRDFHSIPFILAVAFAAGCESGHDAPAEASPVRSDARRFWELHDKAKDFYVAEDFLAARVAYKQALELNPRHTASLYNLANSELHLGHHAAALECLKLLEEADPHETKPKLLAAIVLADPRPEGPFDLAAAQSMLERAVAMNREESGPFLLQGRVNILAGDFAAAEERLLLASRANPLSAEALNLLGVIALRLGRTGSAADLFARAMTAARGAPPPAGLPGEGDTARAGAGYHRLQLLQSKWLLSVASQSVLAAGNAFSPPPHVLGTGSPRSGRALAAADLDGDGSIDLAAGSLAGPLEVYSWKAGSLTLASTVDVKGISFLIAADLDGDSKSDLYALRGGDLGEGEPVMLLSRGGFRFEEVAAPGGSRRTLAAAAVMTTNGVEIIEVGPAAHGVAACGAVRVLRQDGACEYGAWKLETVLGAQEGDCGTSIALLACPGGGTPDAVIAFAHGPPRLFRREASGWRAVERAIGLEVLGPVENVASIDLDGDGMDDLAAARTSKPLECFAWLADGKADGAPVRLLRRVDRNRFEPSPLALPSFAARVTALAVGDIDLDGTEDIVVLSGGPEPWHVEPWCALCRRGGAFELRRGAYPPGTFSACAAVRIDRPPDSESRRALIFAGGGILPADSGSLFMVERERENK